MNRRYQREDKGPWHVSEILKQKFKAAGIEIEIYEERCLQFKQNNLFQINQKLFCETLNRCKQKDNDIPNFTAAAEFWSNIWSKEVNYNENLSCIDDAECECSSTKVKEGI